MSGFYITIKNGLLEPKHIKAMKGEKSGMIWLFLWCLDKMTIIDHEKGEGKVLGGKPIVYQEDIAETLLISERTYNRWISGLRKAGYIKTTRTPRGLSITVFKAFKVFGKNAGGKKSDTPQMAVPKKKEKSERTSRSGGSEPSQVADQNARSGGSNIRQYRDRTEDNTNSTTTMRTAKPSASASSKKKGNPDHKTFLDFWHDMVPRTRGMKPIYTGADMRNLKRILDFGIEEQTLEQIALFFLADYGFKSFSPSISTLCSAGIINGLLNRSKNGNDPEFWRSMTRYMDQYLRPKEKEPISESRKRYDPEDPSTYSSMTSMQDAMKKMLDRYNQNMLEKSTQARSLQTTPEI